jgi:transglutaminase-like putative cysteine protease
LSHRPPPPFLLGSALLFWGAMTGYPWLGAALALVVEAARWSRLRWNFGEAEFSRAWQISTVLSGLAVLAIWLDGNRFEALQILFRWLPALLLPVQFAQCYGLRPTMPLSAFSFFARRHQERQRQLGLPVRQIEVGFGHVYFVVTLLSATLGRMSGEPAFLPGFAALVAWALLAATRGRRAAVFALLLAASGLAVAGRYGLSALYNWLENSRWPQREARGRSNSYRTSIGQLGELKQSTEILWRLRTEQGPVPQRLHTSVYNLYDRGTWSYRIPPEIRGQNNDFEDLKTVTRDGVVYHLASPQSGLEATAGDLPRYRLRGASGTGEPLPVPGDLASLTGFDLEGVERSAVATFRVFPKEAVVSGVLFSQPAATPDAPPWSDPLPQPFMPDLKVPDPERAAVRESVDQLGLRALPLDRKLAAIRAWFRRDFRYTRYLSIPPVTPGGQNGKSALSVFLTKNRAGHCEYFASAATLMLREAGVPTRYAVGFAVQETDLRRQESVIRGIHGHAWCRVWDEDQRRWLDFDPTPPDWLGVEAPHLPSWQWLADAIHRAREDFFLWRSQPENRLRATLAMSAFCLLGLFLIGFRLWKSRHRPRATRPGIPGWTGTAPRTPLHALEKPARRLIGERPPGQTFGHWLARLRDRLDSPDLLDEALALHQRLRFDPDAAEPDLHPRLDTLARRLQAKLAALK